jgi:hypothetical protein
MRAEATAERMEHKNDLYAALGQEALVGVPRPAGVEPRTPIERFTEYRLEKRRAKTLEANDRDRIERRTFGQDESTFPKSVRQSLIDRSVDLVVRDRDSGASVAGSIAENTKAVIVGPGLRGSSNLSKKLQRAQNTLEMATGQKNIREWREDSIKIKAQSPKLGNKSIRKSRRMKRRADERLKHMAEMPLTTKWRDIRLERAQDRATKMQRKKQKHRNAINAIRN